jgi:hypothetical protein
MDSTTIRTGIKQLAVAIRLTRSSSPKVSIAEKQRGHRTPDVGHRTRA